MYQRMVSRQIMKSSTSCSFPSLHCLQCVWPILFEDMSHGFKTFLPLFGIDMSQPHLETWHFPHARLFATVATSPTIKIKIYVHPSNQKWEKSLSPHCSRVGLWDSYKDSLQLQTLYHCFPLALLLPIQVCEKLCLCAQSLVLGILSVCLGSAGLQTTSFKTVLS